MMLIGKARYFFLGSSYRGVTCGSKIVASPSRQPSHPQALLGPAPIGPPILSPPIPVLLSRLHSGTKINPKPNPTHPNPNGGDASCRSVQYDPFKQQAVVRSLLFLGYTFYFSGQDLSYGALYSGFGLRNNDLIFML